MTELSERQRIMDLVEEAGVDITDWANSKRGKAGAAMNPKYCYEWAFIQPAKVVVLNLWFGLMRIDGATIFQNINSREFADQQRRLDRVVVAERAERMDSAIHEAFKKEHSRASCGLRRISSEIKRPDRGFPRQQAIVGPGPLGCNYV